MTGTESAQDADTPSAKITNIMANFLKSDIPFPSILDNEKPNLRGRATRPRITANLLTEALPQNERRAEHKPKRPESGVATAATGTFLGG